MGPFGPFIPFLIMALSLQVGTITQANDNTVIRIEDGTGIYDATTNPGGWGAPNPPVTFINGTTVFLYLDVEYTDSDGATTTYDQIDLHAQYGPFATVNDLVFDLTPNLLTSGGNPMAANGEEFLDGWYKFTYSFVDNTATYTNSTTDTEVLIDGVVRVKVYTELKNVPYINDYERFNNDFKEWGDILYPLYYFTLLEGMIAEVSNARKTEVLEMLGRLERLLRNIE